MAAEKDSAANKRRTLSAHTWDRQEFLDKFEETGMVTETCRQLGVGRTTVYQEKQRNEDFALGWADVEERVVERMEAEAYRRAVDGVEKPLVSAGKLVTHVNEYSDGLLTFLLKARRPEKYRDNVKIEHSGSTTVTHALVTDAGLAASARALLRDAASTSGD